MFRLMLLLIVSLANSATAQDRPRAILVLDASGSMWGQIDGTAKITIAQKVIGDLLQTLPGEQVLGLTAYGHRRKGDCADIETLIPPQGDQRAAIGAAVNAIKPKGKTPMTDAVIAAAQALRYTEEAATVILVSDGVETCNPDPCAAARLLEETGVDFTAHVIGFDVGSDVAALEQMRCIADETGGRFLTAANATELSQALAVVAEPAPAPAPPPAPVPDPVPEPVVITFYATDGKNGPRIGDALIWDLRSTDATLVEAEAVPTLTAELIKGEYVVSVLRPIDEEFAEMRFGVGSVSKTVVLTLPEYRPAATLDAPATAIAGSMVQVRWTGPDAPDDFISVSTPDSAGANWEGYTYTREGPLLDLRMPATPGRFEIRYILADDRKILASQPIEVVAVLATITPPADLPAGATVQVGWSGPDYPNDFIAITKPGEDAYINYAYTREGAPLGLVMPGDPGDYDIVYTLNQDREIIARVPVTVTAISYAVSAAPTAPAGSKVQVDWTGPDYMNDFISVAEIGSDDAAYLGYTYTREGAPLVLEMPLEPGRYEIRYVLNQNRQVEARTEIELLPVSASLDAPDSAGVGGTVQVAWQGPDYKNDFISIGREGEDELKYDRYAYTRLGSPLKLSLPSTAGNYVLRYIAAGNPRTVLASRTMTLTEVQVTMTPPDAIPAGGKIKVGWDGPGNQRDYLAIGKPGEKYVSYAYTTTGNPVTLNVPPEPGMYELRYVLDSDKRVIATRPIQVK